MPNRVGRAWAAVVCCEVRAELVFLLRGEAVVLGWFLSSGAKGLLVDRCQVEAFSTVCGNAGDPGYTHVCLWIGLKSRRSVTGSPDVSKFGSFPHCDRRELYGA